MISASIARTLRIKFDPEPELYTSSIFQKTGDVLVLSRDDRWHKNFDYLHLVSTHIELQNSEEVGMYTNHICYWLSEHRAMTLLHIGTTINISCGINCVSTDMYVHRGINCQCAGIQIIQIPQEPFWLNIQLVC